MSASTHVRAHVGSKRTTADADRPLLVSATLFALAVVVHNGDHVRRGADAVDLDVFWTGTAAIALEVAIVVLACQRHRVAPLAAAVGGAGLTAGYVVVHFLPERSWLSDSFTSGAGVEAVSWFAASLEVAAALLLAVVGVMTLRARGGLASARAPRHNERALRDAVVHPVALGFAASQTVVVVVGFAQL